VLALGARLIGLEAARDCLLTFLDTPFAGAATRRLAKLVGNRTVSDPHVP
jgi:hypothetical protein